MKYTRVLVVLLYLMFSDTVYALRCGHTLVQLGDRKREVSKKCGKPDAIEKHIERRAVQNSVNIAKRFSKNTLSYGRRHSTEVDVSVEEWTYDFGRSRFQQLLRFENGVLTDIEDLGRGD